MKKNIVILGSGAWGTALAKHCHSLSNKVTIWCRRQSTADDINKLYKNNNLSGINLKGISATTDKSITKNADIILIAIPSQNIRTTLNDVWIKKNTPVIICSKGIELNTLKLLGQVVSESINVFCKNNINKKTNDSADIMILSGPTFAKEVALNMPTSVTLATNNLNSTNTLSVIKSMQSNNFQIHLSTDIIGTEICGGVKNVIAIACGIIVGKQLGDNAKASLIANALSEISDLSIAVGGKRDTVLQMCCIGDLILTCSSIQSRNMSFGVLLGQGKTANEILASRKTITEGVLNCKSINDLANLYNVKMPICKSVHKILHKKP
jgi:glycerol-3-phosphate dehydrogenase (NAD(P)+)